jgi:hypothetical protein
MAFLGSTGNPNNPFSAGHVPPGDGDPAKYLSADGTFKAVSGAAGGTVTSLTFTAPLTGGTITTSGSPGIAITTTNDGGAVVKQAATPGTAQTGHANLSGTVIAGAFAGPLTGNVTGNASGSSATTTLAASTSALKSATTTIDVSAATAPSATQVLTAVDSTHATWQAAGGATPRLDQVLDPTADKTFAMGIHGVEFSSPTGPGIASESVGAIIAGHASLYGHLVFSDSSLGEPIAAVQGFSEVIDVDNEGSTSIGASGHGDIAGGTSPMVASHAFGVVGIASASGTADFTQSDPAIAGVLAQAINNSSGLVANIAGVRIRGVGIGGGGSITNNYGLFIDGQGGATNNYAIKTGLGLNSFGDAVSTVGQITSTLATGTAPLVVASTTPVSNLTLANHALVSNGGTTTTCANTPATNARIVFGTVPLTTGTPSTATVTGISPAFTSAASYVVVVTQTTSATGNLLKVANVDGTSFTVTGPTAVTDVISYLAIGN